MTCDNTSEKERLLLLAHNWNYENLRPYNVGIQLSRRGYRVSLIVPARGMFLKKKIEMINPNFALYFSPTMLWGGLSKGSDPLDFVTRMSIIRGLEFDLIIAFDSRPTVILPAVVWKKLRRVPLVIDWTDWFGRGGTASQRPGLFSRFLFELVETFFEEFFLRYANGYTVICPSLSERLRSLGYNERIHQFPLACDSVPFVSIEKSELRRQLGLPTDVAVVGCVGSLFSSDAQMLFESFDIVKERMEARLLLVGDNHYGHRYPIPKDVLITGRVRKDELLQYIYCCDLMVLPLRNNIANNGRWPSKLNDYLVMGKPVVSTKVSVVNHLYQLSPFGELAEDQPEDFAKAICRLLGDQESLARYGAGAKHLASEYLSWPKVIDDLESFLFETVQSSAKGGARKIEPALLGE